MRKLLLQNWRLGIKGIEKELKTANDNSRKNIP